MLLALVPVSIPSVSILIVEFFKPEFAFATFNTGVVPISVKAPRTLTASAALNIVLPSLIPPVRLPLTSPVCVPASIVAVESWLAVAPAAAPLLIVATAVPPTDPVRSPLNMVAVLLLSTLLKPMSPLSKL